MISENHVLIHMYFINDCQIIASVNTYHSPYFATKREATCGKNYLQEKIMISFDISASTTSSTNKAIKATRGSGIPAPGSAGTR